MIVLRIHSQGAEPYKLTEHEPALALEEAIHAEAEMIAAGAGSELLDDPGDAARTELRDKIVEAATAALKAPGDTYRDPQNMLWSLDDATSSDHDGVRWEGDGSYTPACRRCDWTGKRRRTHSDAAAAVRSHERTHSEGN